MTNNYPDDVPAGSPRAPWNQPDHREPDPLICYWCDHEPALGLGDEGFSCRAWFYFPSGLGCTGTYISQRCTECGGLGDGCNCDEE